MLRYLLAPLQRPQEFVRLALDMGEQRWLGGAGQDFAHGVLRLVLSCLTFCRSLKVDCVAFHRGLFVVPGRGLLAGQVAKLEE